MTYHDVVNLIQRDTARNMLESIPISVSLACNNIYKCAFFSPYTSSLIPSAHFSKSDMSPTTLDEMLFHYCPLKLCVLNFDVIPFVCQHKSIKFKHVNSFKWISSEFHEIFNF